MTTMMMMLAMTILTIWQSCCMESYNKYNINKTTKQRQIRSGQSVWFLLTKTKTKMVKNAKIT